MKMLKGYGGDEKWLGTVEMFRRRCNVEMFRG